MKFVFTLEEKKLATGQLIQLAMQAGQIGDRELSRHIMRVANKFSDNTLNTDLRVHEYNMLLDLSSKTLETIENDVIPKIETSNKTDKEKAEVTQQAKDILVTTQMFIEKLRAIGVT